LSPITHRVYVDEAGDLGLSPASSRYFVLSAVVVADADDARLRSELARMRVSLGRHPRHALHFVKFSHSKRLKAVQDIASSSATAIANVAISKDSIAERLLAGGTEGSRCTSVYFVALGLLLRHVARCVSMEASGKAVMTFSQLKGLSAEKLHGYRAEPEGIEGAGIHWPVFEGHPFRLRGMKEVELLQLADVTASALFHAVEPDIFGNVESRYVEELRPKLFEPGETVSSSRPIASVSSSPVSSSS
jgi:hypothetical protein